MIDPLAAETLAAAAAALAGAGITLSLRRRVRHVEAVAAALRQQLQAERYLAGHDPLTGLPNRRAFFRRGEAMLAEPGRPPLVAVVVDLDDFKHVNDWFGHAAGDQVLVTVAGRLAALVGDGLMARLGGDEFAGLLAGPGTDHHSLRRVAATLTEALGTPMHIAGHRFRVTASVGAVVAPAGSALSEVLRCADAAMYRVKTQVRATASVPAAPAPPHWSTTMPTPTIDPHQRDPAAVAPADSYQHADPVWVYRADSWRAGVVEAASPQAVTVTYRPPNTRGTGVDTLTAPYLLPREDVDPLLDHRQS